MTKPLLLDTSVASLLHPRKSNQSLLPPDAELIRRWARVSASAAAAGRHLESPDAWVVATAVRHSLTLVTHDRDLIDLPIPGLNVLTHLK